MSRPSRCSVPEVVPSNPAINRSKVDLPQPEGPTKTTNSPLLISRSMPLIVRTGPNSLTMFLSSRNAISCSLFHCAEGQALDELLLAEPAENDDRCNGQQRSRRQLGPEQTFR